jgi:plasmid stability protein
MRTDMATLTIRNIDDALKRRLRLRAAERGRSMEEEVREILRMTLGPSPPSNDLGQSIHNRFAALGGVEFELPARGPMRQSPAF